MAELYVTYAFTHEAGIAPAFGRDTVGVEGPEAGGLLSMKSVRQIEGIIGNRHREKGYPATGLHLTWWTWLSPSEPEDGR